VKACADEPTKTSVWPLKYPILRRERIRPLHRIPALYRMGWRYRKQGRAEQ